MRNEILFFQYRMLNEIYEIHAINWNANIPSTSDNKTRSLPVVVFKINTQAAKPINAPKINIRHISNEFKADTIVIFPVKKS